MTMHNDKFKLNKAILESLENTYGGNIKIFNNKIPRPIRAVEHTALDKSLIHWQEKSYKKIFFSLGNIL